MDQTVTVFRCGAIERPKHKPYVHSSFEFFDSAAPEGRVLRGEAIFASPERAALSPWIAMKERRKKRADICGISNKIAPNKVLDQDIFVRHLELIMDDSLFVYNADIFGEIHLEAFDKRFDSRLVDATPYWETGIPLSEWKSSSFANTSAAESWEVLVAPHHIGRVKMESLIEAN